MNRMSVMFAVGLWVIGLASCDNKTKQKVVNGSVITADAVTDNVGTTNVGATTVLPAQTVAGQVYGLRYSEYMITSSWSNVHSWSAPRRMGAMALERASGLPYTKDSDGWFKYSYSETGHAYTQRYRLLNAAGEPLIGSTEDDLWGSNRSAAKSCEYINTGFDNELLADEPHYDNPRTKCEYSGYIKWIYNTPGDFSHGGREDGNFSMKITYKDGTEQTFHSSIEGLTISYDPGDGYYHTVRIIAGTIRCSYYGWNTVITYAANGSAAGTITGPNYTATIHINTSGDIYYTDNTGEHSGTPVKL